MTVISEEKEKDLTVESFATLTAIKGEQFGKEIFSALLKFKELDEFLQVFPEVQRTANTRKIANIKSYILTGLEINKMRFFSSLTASVRGHTFYEEATKRVAINTAQSKLSVNDGQHRALAVSETLSDLYKKLDSKRITKDEKESVLNKIDMLENMSIPIVIFNNITVEEEQQLFYDLNQLSTKPPRSIKIKFSQTDILSRLAREVAAGNQFLKEYGVEYDKATIHPNNPNTVLLTTIYAWCQAYVTKKYSSKEGLVEENFNSTKKAINDILNAMFRNLPKDISTKGKYILNKGFALRAIFVFILNKLEEEIPKNKIYLAIKKTDWSDSEEVWAKYEVKAQQNGSLLFPGNNTGGFTIVQRVLQEQLDALK